MHKKVKVASIEDLDFIYDALREDLEEQGVLHRFKYSKEEFEKTIFGEKPPGTFLILLMNGQAAGFANYSIDHRNFTANCFKNLYINDLFIKIEFRRMWGATYLLDQLQEIAQQENCGCIEWVVLAENTNALNFYKKFDKSKIISDKLHYMRLELNQL